MFEAIEFEKACDELDRPDVSEYEFFTEHNDVKIYRLYNEESGLYQYKIYGGIQGVTAEQCAKVYMDVDYRRQWDTYVQELTEVSDGVLYWQVKFPFPMSNRDYLYQRELRELDMPFGGDKHVWVILARSVESAEHPPKSGVIRVGDYLQSMAITDDGKGGTKAFMRYYDNPGGMIPTWLINFAAKTGVPQFLTLMEKACEGYPEYLQTNRTMTI